MVQWSTRCGSRGSDNDEAAPKAETAAEEAACGVGSDGCVGSGGCNEVLETESEEAATGGVSGGGCVGSGGGSEVLETESEKAAAGGVEDGERTQKCY